MSQPSIHPLAIHSCCICKEIEISKKKQFSVGGGTQHTTTNIKQFGHTVTEARHILFLRILYPIHIQALNRISYHYHGKIKDMYIYPISYILCQFFCCSRSKFVTESWSIVCFQQSSLLPNARSGAQLMTGAENRRNCSISIGLIPNFSVWPST
jgi:hypothetical protein